MAKLAKLAQEFLTATGLPYEVGDAPPIRPNWPKGIVITFNGEEAFYYVHERVWWRFSSGVRPPGSPLTPSLPTSARSTDWPLRLPLADLSSRLHQAKAILYNTGGYLKPKYESDAESVEHRAFVLDVYVRAIQLLQLAVDGRMRLNTRAIRPYARTLLQLFPLPPQDPSLGGKP